MTELLKHKPVLAILGIGFLGLACWYLLCDEPGEAVGAACEANRVCQSGVCLPDADPAEVDRFVEITQAFELGSRANPKLVGQMGELIKNMPRSSITLRPVYPGVCTRRCISDPDCPEGMFCGEAVWVKVIKGAGQDRIRICMPDGHPAARLMR